MLKNFFTVTTVDISAINCNYASKELFESITSDTSGVVLIRGSNAFFDMLSSMATYEDRQGLFKSQNEVITIHLCPVCYGLRCDTDTDTDLIHCRLFTASNLYYRWCKFSGKKRNAKYCYDSKPFMKYLNSIEYYKTDYVVFMVD